MSDVKATVKAKAKVEWAKLKEMPLKEKCWYIWEYYKIAIIGGLLIVFIGGSLINTWFINPPKKTSLYVAWFGLYETEAQLQALAGQLTEALVENPAREEVVVSSFLLSDDPSLNVATYNRLMVMLSAGEIDIFVVDKTNLSDLAQNGYLDTLNGLINALTALDDPALTARIAPLVTEVDYIPDEYSPPAPYSFGVNLVDCPMLNRLGAYTQDLYLAISVNTKHIDNAARALQVMYE